MKISMQDGSIREVTFEEELGKNAFRHTTAHILAQAVKRLYPNTKCAIGPAIADGFYYDFEFDFEFSADRFEEIEAEMRKIVKENLQLRHYAMSREKAVKLMEEQGETYKVELIRDLPEDAELSFYQQGEYVELCAGPHAAYTSAVKTPVFPAKRIGFKEPVDRLLAENPYERGICGNIHAHDVRQKALGNIRTLGALPGDYVHNDD